MSADQTSPAAPLAPVRKPPAAPAPTLFDVPSTTPTGRTKKGETRLALERQLRRLRASGQLAGRGETLIAQCRILADATDVARRRLDLYAVAALAPQLRAALADLEPTETTDDLNDFLGGLMPPELGHRPDA